MEVLQEAAGRAARASIVVDPYVIDVAIVNGSRRPQDLREAIRAFGPSGARALAVEGS